MVKIKDSRLDQTGWLPRRHPPPPAGVGAVAARLGPRGWHPESSSSSQRILARAAAVCTRERATFPPGHQLVQAVGLGRVTGELWASYGPITIASFCRDMMAGLDYSLFGIQLIE